MSQELLSLAKNFHKQYPSLTNLKKFNNAEYAEWDNMSPRIKIDIIINIEYIYPEFNEQR